MSHYAAECYAMLCYDMLCYAMLCYAMLRYAMLCYAMLCYAMLCYAMLRYATLCYAMLCYAMSTCSLPASGEVPSIAPHEGVSICDAMVREGMLCDAPCSSAGAGMPTRPATRSRIAVSTSHRVA
jgi:hypothetical protein